MGRVYALANQKGGVGKTTTAVNLGAYLAQAGKRVLLVDVDPQANATSSLGIDKNALLRSTYELLVGGEKPGDLITLTNCMGLDLLPSTPSLAGAEVRDGRDDRPRAKTAHGVERHSRPVRFLLDRHATQPGYVDGQCVGRRRRRGHSGAVRVSASGRLDPIAAYHRAGSAESQPRAGGARRGDDHVRLTHQSGAAGGRGNPHPLWAADVSARSFRRSIKLGEAPSYGEAMPTYAPESSGGQAYAALCQEFLASE